MRTKFVAGNWKMNTTPSEGADLASEILKGCAGFSNVDIVVCPPYTGLDRVSSILKGSKIGCGAQDMYPEEQGAFTGKINHDMLKDLNLGYVIVGHSERRAYFHETNESVNTKTKKAILEGLIPIVCIGETLEEREAGKIEEVVGSQVKEGLAGISKDDILKAVLAYEPVWAIGTGKTATPDQAQEVHAYIRKLLTELYDQTTAQKVRILYGGSVKPDNAQELFSQTDIDGGLIGGASLKADGFCKIVEAATK